MTGIEQKDESRRRFMRAALGAFLCCTILGATLGTQRTAWGQDVKAPFQIIVHPDVGFNTIEREVLADIFLKQRTTWPDGSTAHPADQLSQSPVRTLFSNHVIRRSVQAVKSYWQQRIFSGRGVPPPELDSDEAVQAYVRGRSGAVGYVSLKAEINGVKVIYAR